MLINELAKAVHENAVAHGWWDDEREAPEIIALIHSEWSEALEEARAGRPLVWYGCGEAENSNVVCNPQDEYECRMYGRELECEFRAKKPEGIAVELIDGCIRILDLFGKLNINALDDEADTPYEIEGLYDEEVARVANYPISNTVAYLHGFTSDALKSDSATGPINPGPLTSALALAFSWVKNQGLDPLAILLEKHEFNKTRPYKHGKKF